MYISHHILKALASERIADLRREAADRREPPTKPHWFRRPRRAPKRRHQLSPARSEE
jgi:hypothetical protein